MALPVDFITRTRTLLGDEYEKLEQALQDDVPVSIRLNPAKGLQLAQGTPIPWSQYGYYLPERLSFTFDPLFHAGTYYVQEASSMFLEQAIRTYIQKPVVCLDLCAAPGGKSTDLHSMLPEGSVVVSNEVIRPRSYVLAENMQKWGYPNQIVTNNDPEEIGKLTHLFDLIVTDVPCSGEGMFRKDVDSTGEWSVANVQLCAARQKRIIHDIWNALKPGGILIYSTCTYNTEENEENIQYFIEELGATPLAIPTLPEWNIHPALKYDNPVYHFFPHLTKGEGFFLAALQKTEGEIETIRPKGKDKKQKNKQTPTAPSETAEYLSGGDWKAVWRETTLFQLSPECFSVYSLLSEKLHLLSSGVEIGMCKGKDFIPSQSLALSTKLNPDAFPKVEIGWEQAVAYLRKEAMFLPEQTPKGYVLLTYKKYPLGFVKNLGNRANNLYPQEWRIRSGYNPEELKIL